MSIRTFFITSVYFLSAVASLPAQTDVGPTIYRAGDTSSPNAYELVWPATPGVRYEVQQSENLTNWTIVPGFPAMAFGPALEMPFSATNDFQFFRVAELDEQPPVIVDQYPQDGGFAVSRFADITLELSDVTGVDTTSIQLIVGTNGTFTLADAQLTYSNGVLRFDSSGDTGLGGWGATNEVTLIVADVLGNIGIYEWSFELELAPITVGNLFVFGSPQAQRAGQRVGAIPTAALALHSGPIPMGAGNPWALTLVESNRLEISYTNAPPVFSNSTYVCNLTPATTSEIFYRDITSISDDPTNKLLTLYTTNVSLAEILEEGSKSLSEESVLYAVDTNGVIVAALSGDFEKTVGSIGPDYSKKVLLHTGGISLNLEEAKFVLNPSLQVSFETHGFSLQRFKALLHGQLETALVPELTVEGSLADEFDFDLYNSKSVVYVGQAGPVPIWLDFNFGVTAQVGYNLQADATMTTGIRKNMELGFGMDYVRGRSPELTGSPYVTPEPTEIVPFAYEINGTANMYATIIPKLDVRVDSLAGVYANVDPRVEVAGEATIVNGGFTNANLCVVADADLNVGLNVIGVGNVGELPVFKLFNKHWCTTVFPFLDRSDFTANGWDITGSGDAGSRIKWDQYGQPPNSATKTVVIAKSQLNEPIFLHYNYGVSNNRLEVYVNDTLVAFYQNHDNKDDNGDMPYRYASHEISGLIPSSGVVTIRFVNAAVFLFYNHTKIDDIGLSH